MSGNPLPTHIEVSALIRAVEAAGGFATVINKGERDAGAILVLTVQRGENSRLWERLPSLDGSRVFSVTREEDPGNPSEFAEYLKRRVDRDRDSWVIELDIANAERFVAALTR